MLEKYKDKFEEIYKKIVVSKSNPTEVIKDYIPLFRDEGIGAIGIAHYLIDYVKEKGKEIERLNC